jgi:signal transduction histidine kinase
VVKQAKASRIGIAITREGATIQVKVEGDGVGQGVAGGTPLGVNGLGLFGIRERLRCLGGDLTVGSASGAGTGVTLVLPLKY